MTNAEKIGRLEAEAKKLLARLYDHDRLEPGAEEKSRHEIGRTAIRDLLTQVGRELRRLRERVFPQTRTPPDRLS